MIQLFNPEQEFPLFSLWRAKNDAYSLVRVIGMDLDKMVNYETLSHPLPPTRYRAGRDAFLLQYEIMR